MKRTSRATLTAAALLSCTLAFSGCSLIDQVAPPDQDGQSGERAGTDGQEQQAESDDSGQKTGTADNSSEPGAATSSDSGSTADSDTSGTDSDTSGTDSDTNGTDSDTNGTDDGSSDSDDGSADSDAAASSGNQAEVSIGKSFTDPEMDDDIEVLSAVRDFDSSNKAVAIENGGEVVLLEVKVTPGQKYGGLIQAGAFKISADGGADYRYNATSGVKDEMKAAGYDPLEDVARRDGGTHQGWIAYVPDEKKDTYKIRYERRAGKVLGTDEKVPEFTTTFDIPAD